MSFALRNAAQTFQSFIDDVLKELDSCFAYLDDILVFSHSPTSIYDIYVHSSRDSNVWVST